MIELKQVHLLTKKIQAIMITLFGIFATVVFIILFNSPDIYDTTKTFNMFIYLVFSVSETIVGIYFFYFLTKTKKKYNNYFGAKITKSVEDLKAEVKSEDFRFKMEIWCFASFLDGLYFNTTKTVQFK